MKLQQFKEEINKLNLSKDVFEVINGILDKSIEKKEITDGEKEELSNLIKLETDALVVYSNSLDEFSQALAEYDKDIETIADNADNEMKKIEDDFNNDVNGVVNNIQLVQTRARIDSL